MPREGAKSHAHGGATMNATVAFLAVWAVVGSGLMGGLLFAFSSFVMRALRELPPESAAAAMREVNLKILNPLFVLLFLGTALVCVALTWLVGAGAAGPAGPWLVAGSVAYLAGPLAVTMAFNVPLNERLAVGPIAAAAAFWPAYELSWTRWNHVRTVFAVVAAAPDPRATPRR